jgi:hypothetical protein
MNVGSDTSVVRVLTRLDVVLCVVPIGLFLTIVSLV